MVYRLNELHSGMNCICAQNGSHSCMMMDVDLLKMEESESKTFYHSAKETALLLLTGKVIIKWLGNSAIMSRTSLFKENPWCIHFPSGAQIEITALAESEFIVQSTDNPSDFEVRLYAPQDCRDEFFGDGEWDGTARREVRTIFDYKNAPYSNMVIGEVITFPGKWSSYPPHHHPQPEVYYYRFDKPQGFGMCLNGDSAYMITDNSFATIKGGDVHPQTAAPGYTMYYCWMIRHLDNNPWTDRILDEKHAWLCKPEHKNM